MTTSPLAQLAQALASAAEEAALVELGGDPVAAEASKVRVGEALGAVLAMPEVLAVIDARVAAALG